MNNLKIYKVKKRLGALLLAGTILGTADVCAKKSYTSDENTTSIIQKNEEELNKLKLNILENIDNMEVTKNEENNAYHIVEVTYVPVYETIEDNGTLIQIGTEIRKTSEYNILYEDAIYLEIDELLESKVISYSKTK